MNIYKKAFDAYMGVKQIPNEHEIRLFERTLKYVRRIDWIPCIEMISVVNSLSMYATHKDSDIDLFIITKPGTLWFVRLLVTGTLWISGVWRHGEDIAENFCLSFWITTESMDMAKIAVKNDVYLYYWIYYMRPILTRGDIYERFLSANKWVTIPHEQIRENQEYTLTTEGRSSVSQKHLKENAKNITEKLCKYLNIPIRYILLKKTFAKYRKLGKPKGVIISDSMLKFHDQDRREEIREEILKKNFDK